MSERSRYPEERDKHTGPAETAAGRIDVAPWFRSLARKKWRIAQELSRGQGTENVAVTFGLTVGRVSQSRRELAEPWEEFPGMSPAATGGKKAKTWLPGSTAGWRMQYGAEYIFEGVDSLFLWREFPQEGPRANRQMHRVPLPNR